MLLAIDTSTRVAGLALFDGVQFPAEAIWTSGDTHTVELAPAIEQAFARARLHPQELRMVAVALGPGSFTSLRIGLAFAKGVALAWRLPIIGVPTLDVLSAAQPLSEMPLAAVLRAGRGRLAVGWYRVVSGQWKSEGPLQVLSVAELSQKITRPTRVCGELTAEERRFLSRKWKNVHLASPAHCLRRPSFLAELAWQRWQAGQVDDPVSLAPIYLHSGESIPG